MTVPADGPAGDQIESFATHQFEFLRSLERYGSAVWIELGGTPTLVLYNLETIHRVFGDKLVHVDMPSLSRRLQAVTGSGLLTNFFWPTWHPRRRLIVKPVGARAVGRFAARMASIIDEELNGWPVNENFELRDRVHAMTLRVVADLLFSESLTAEAIGVVGRIVDEIHAWSESDPANLNVTEPPAAFREALADVDGYIGSVIASRDPAAPGDDMLGILISAITDDGVPIDVTGVRDEAITMVLAGHETVTATISFAIDLVGRHWHTRALDRRWIVDETLRLYPPVHFLTRLISQDFDVGGFTIPAGCEVLIPIITIARDERYFERAGEFLPERWAEDSPLRMERRAYFPFLTGPKFCVGSHFALLEATEAVGRFLDRFQHEMLDPEPPWGREFALSFAPDRPLPCRLALR